jgi:hypothetical protein
MCADKGFVALDPDNMDGEGEPDIHALVCSRQASGIINSIYTLHQLAYSLVPQHQWLVSSSAPFCSCD